MNLRQTDLHTWQSRNFPRSRYEALSKSELIDMIILLQVTLGVCEEAGELAHAILKGTQRIRSGINGIDKEAVSDAVGDIAIFGAQVCSEVEVDAERAIEETVDLVLARDWVANPSGNQTA